MSGCVIWSSNEFDGDVITEAHGELITNMVEDAAPKGRSNLISLLPVVSRNSTADPNNARDNPSQQ